MLMWRTRKGQTKNDDLVLTPADWELDAPAFFEARIRDSQIHTWESAIDLVTSHGITLAEVADTVQSADPEAGTGAVCGFVWGIANALRARANEPCDTATWIASGLEDMSIPDSCARTAKLARGYGQLAAMLMRRWSTVMAIVDSDPDANLSAGLVHLAEIAGGLRGEEWETILLTARDSRGSDFAQRLGYTAVDAEFSSEPGWCRVERTSLAQDRDFSVPSVFTVSGIDEGVAVLDFMMANLCISISRPEAVMFAHPVAATYARQVRGGRLIKTIALDRLSTRDGEQDLMARLSGYMVGMYADLDVRAVGQSANAMRDTGFIRMRSFGVIEALMRLACRTASALPKGLA